MTQRKKKWEWWAIKEPNGKLWGLDENTDSVPILFKKKPRLALYHRELWVKVKIVEVK